MNFNTLRYVVAVAEERNFTRAAQQLYISQPSLSQSIQALENKLGTPLFDRKTTPLTLTNAGKVYVEWAKDILLSESQMNRRLMTISREKTSRLYVGISPHRSVFMLPGIARQMAEEFPECSLVIVEEPNPRLYECLEKREVDLMINEAPADAIRYTSTFVANERMILAVPSSYGIRGKAPEREGDYPSVRLFQVKDKPFISLQVQHYMGHSIRAMCEQEEFVPIYGVECGRVETARMMVSQGIGMTVLPEFFVQYTQPVPGIDYFSIAKIHPHRDVSVVYRTESYLTEPAQRFIELFQREFGGKKKAERTKN